MTRPTYAEIVLPALARNLAVIAGRLSHEPPGSEIIGVVKADAYGHGAVEITRALMKRGVRKFAVACIEEALELKNAGVLGKGDDAGRVIILGPLRREEVAEIAAEKFIPSLSSMDDLEALAGANRPGAAVEAVMVVDTGMGRMGFLAEEIPRVADRVKSIGGLEIIGLFSHFPVADGREEEDVEFTRRQLEDFRLVVSGLLRAFPLMKLISIANSSGIFFHEGTAMRAVRPGISLYGVKPAAQLAEPAGLEPVLRWVTKIDQIRVLPKGASVSYLRKTILTRPSRIALLPVGYGDGLRRTLPPGFNFMVRGKPAPIAGVVTMDLCMLDVTDVPEAGPGDRVLIMGRDPATGAEVRAEDHALAAGTIPYEVLTSIGKRVKRKYIEEE